MGALAVKAVLQRPPSATATEKATGLSLAATVAAVAEVAAALVAEHFAASVAKRPPSATAKAKAAVAAVAKAAVEAAAEVAADLVAAASVAKRPPSATAKAKAAAPAPAGAAEDFAASVAKRPPSATAKAKEALVAAFLRLPLPAMALPATASLYVPAEASPEPSERAFLDEGSVNEKTVEPLKCISPNGEFKHKIKCWQKGKFLGSGAFGVVYEGLTDDGSFVAVKEVYLLDQEYQGKQSISQLEQEISLLSQFEHENIVQYFGRDKDDSKLYIFLELVNKGSLSELYQKYELLDSQVSVYTRQILNGLSYLHGQKVVHRDIKCANILVDASGSIKLADFGLAKVTKLNDIKSMRGTSYWMAPEVIKNQGYGLAADIWSLGCTVLEMLTGEIPYSHLEGQQALYRIVTGKLPDIPTSLSTDARDFILKCLQHDPGDRPTAAQLLDHPFVKLSSSFGLSTKKKGSLDPLHHTVMAKAKKALTGP